MSDQAAKNRGRYRMGWIVAMFDIPVLTKEQRRGASDFRKALLDDGFVMLQYSVYARPCVTAEHLEKYGERVRRQTPTDGYVRIMFFTDRQWGLSINIMGGRESAEGPPGTDEIPEQIMFW